MTAPFTSAQKLLRHQIDGQVELVLWGDPTPVKLIAVGAVKGEEFALVKIFDPVKRVDEPQRIAMNEIQEVRLSE